MKRLPTDSKHFAVFRMLNQHLGVTNATLSDEASSNDFIKELVTSLRQHMANPIMLHGFRIQTMFAYLAASLGACRIITEEDGGELFLATPDLKRPDFRILTHEGQEFFVEVKNFNQSNSLKSLTLPAHHVDQLRNYAAAFQKPLLFAIYWRRWETWTLNSLDNFSSNKKNYSISLTSGIKSDQKSILGDCFIGISKPLALRFYTDPTKSRKVNAMGEAKFTIGNVAFFTSGREITDELEAKLAWFFLRFGSWKSIEQPVCIENGELISFDLLGAREDPNPDQNFLMIGQLSQMISRQFNSLTCEQGDILRLSPQVDPDQLGVSIPKDYKGSILGIWRFTLQPSMSAFDSKPKF